ncbi:hypothetical protein V0U79_07720 [Hyphobacterium sp. HN65]|uniref:Secreted protein n=1 Tax=Hyphobacterium lacteum TaxID=3116575 RepID=A0ABU7LQR1_9PROT|nr:hypothetical protein [Hyphobacterium sp. HN65]MEE2526251.1 hypothetical protein [Hyphobacterium sp. HN65]
MVQFLLNLFEAFAGFAMLSLGLSFTAEIDTCVMEVELIPAQYYAADFAIEPDARACVTSGEAESEATEVFRI